MRYSYCQGIYSYCLYIATCSIIIYIGNYYIVATSEVAHLALHNFEYILILRIEGYCYSVIAGFCSHDPVLARVCSPAHEAISDRTYSRRDT